MELGTFLQNSPAGEFVADADSEAYCDLAQSQHYQSQSVMADHSGVPRKRARQLANRLPCAAFHISRARLRKYLATLSANVNEPVGT